MKTRHVLIPYHGLVFTIYPVLALLAHNVLEVNLNVVWRPLGVAFGAGVLLHLIFRYLLFRRWQSAAIAVTLVMVLFYSYGHLYSLLKGVQLGSVFLFRHRTLGPLYLLLGGLGFWWLVRNRNSEKKMRLLSRGLNVVAAILLLYPSYRISRFLWLQSQYETSATVTRLDGDARAESLAEEEALPDIYYIILDSYTRADVLAREGNYDNSEFLDYLQNLGFYVADCSVSNYSKTILSLASSLNYTYLENLTGGTRPGELPPYEQLPVFIKQSAIRQFLEVRGYQTIAFETNYPYTEIRDAARFFALPESYYASSGFVFNAFEQMLFQTTAMRVLGDVVFLETKAASQPGRTPQSVLWTLSRLPEIPRLKSPKFVFVHLLIPHPPYVFSPEGEIKWDGTGGIQGYVDQVIYINHRMEAILSALIRNSPRPPVIILQGDHGILQGNEDMVASTSPLVQMGILNAYYLPGRRVSLYESISPVNSFRIVLNQYFDQELPLLPDRSYLSLGKVADYHFREVHLSCPEVELSP